MTESTTTKKGAKAAGAAVETDQDRYLATFAQDEKGVKAAKEFLAMSEEDRRDEVAMWLELQAPVALEGVNLVEAKAELENLKILSPGAGPLKPGAVIQGYLEGTCHVFAKDKKENWREFYAADGSLFYANDYFKLKTVSGKEIAIWMSPTLRILQKVLTHTAAPKVIAKNPLVVLKYVGKIVGKERLKQEFGIELQAGDSCHVFDVKIEDGAKIFQYQKGCLNSLNRPVPTTGKKEDVDVDALNLKMYEQLSGAPALALGFDDVVNAESNVIAQ